MEKAPSLGVMLDEEPAGGDNTSRDMLLLFDQENGRKKPSVMPHVLERAMKGARRGFLQGRTPKKLPVSASNPLSLKAQGFGREISRWAKSPRETR